MSWPLPSNRPVTYPKLGVRIFPDGREVCLENAEGKRLYRRRTLAMRDRQLEICRLCGLWMHEDETTFDHGIPRGMGGGFTDDRIDIVDEEGNFINTAAHMKCNGAKGSKRLAGFWE